MSSPIDNLHPADVPLYVRTLVVARAVAARYGLRMSSFEPIEAKHARGRGCLGECDVYDGIPRILYRAVNAAGEWMPGARPEFEVWRTVAHELAHLRYPNHDANFRDFMAELLDAVTAERFK